MKRFVKRLFLKIYIKMYKMNTKQDRILRSEYEEIAIKICRKAINSANATLLLCPKTGKRYVKNDELSNYIIIQSNQIDIINHNYQYNVPICSYTYNKILTMFDGNVETKRQKMEDDIMINVNHSLNTIYENLK